MLHSVSQSRRIPRAETYVALATAAWGALGVVALLAQALYRLTPYALEPLRAGSLSPIQGALYAAWVAFSLYFEGYRAFHRRFSPRVVARALHLASHRRASHVALAPAFCMALFHATRRATTLAWGTVVMVLCFIVLLRHVPQPWRGIVDGGVVAALAWGTLAIVYHFVRGLRGEAVPGDTELP